MTARSRTLPLQFPGKGLGLEAVTHRCLESLWVLFPATLPWACERSGSITGQLQAGKICKGDAVFAYVSGLNLKLRGHSLNPANEPPPTYKDIVEANQQAEAQKSAKAASAAANQPAEGGGGSDSEDIPVVKAVGYQGGQLQSKQPKKNKTLKGKGGGAAASADGTVKSSSKQGKGPKDPIADQLKNLDEDMKKVGEKHLATPKGSGVKSLELLISENFLYNDPKLSRGNSAALTGVPVSIFTFSPSMVSACVCVCVCVRTI